MNQVPLYPNTWNVWNIAFTGRPTNVDVMHASVSTSTRAKRWLTQVSRGHVDRVDLIDQPSTSVVRRREQLDTIPTLPPGDTFVQAVRWFYTGSDDAMPWPADTEAMLLSAHQPDRGTQAPTPSPGDSLTDWFSNASSMSGLFWAFVIYKLLEPDRRN